MEDVYRGGDLDRLLWFNARELVLDGSSTEGTLIGVTFDGTRIYGSDMVKMVGHFTSPIMVPVP